MSLAGELAAGARDAGPTPSLAMPPRPPRRLSSWGLLRTFPANSLAACDEQLFDDLFVERRYLWGRLFVVSDPDGLRRVLQDNHENYQRIAAFRRIFEFSSGGGMGCLEGERWSHHRRIVNPALDQRALRPDLPALVEMTTEMAALLADLPRGQQVELGRTLQHLITRTTAHVWAGEAPGVDEMVLRMSRYPERYSVLDLLPAPAWLRSVGRRRGSRTGVDGYYAPLDRLIAERREPDYAGRKDLLWRLAHTQDRQTGEMLTTAEIGRASCRERV